MKTKTNQNQKTERPEQWKDVAEILDKVFLAGAKPSMFKRITWTDAICALFPADAPAQEPVDDEALVAQLLVVVRRGWPIPTVDAPESVEDRVVEIIAAVRAATPAALPANHVAVHEDDLKEFRGWIERTCVHDKEEAAILLEVLDKHVEPTLPPFKQRVLAGCDAQSEGGE